MDDDDSDDNTLENGRKQLHLLSKQLHEHKIGDQSVGSGNRQNLQAERKLLDQKPRGDRLKNRKGSPLGLTLEELDDRGLLDGGGVVPSYYTSLKQKQRRSLELQRRSSRMKLRGHEDELKTYSLDSLMRMIRVLLRNGINFEDLFQGIDAEGRGIIEKYQFVNLIKEFGLPFTAKDIGAFAQTYSVSTEHMDYEAFLQEIISKIEPFVDGDDSFASHQPMYGSASCGNLMRDLYRMLHESKSRLNKSVDDIYRMFSCWDHSGKGTVTSTQFFRVLSQMHVTFSDNEQDFIVELLDTNSEGKINFDSLLSYCFHSSLDDDTAQGSGGYSHQHACEGGDESVVTLEGGSTAGGTVSATDVRSVTSGNAAKRPHTAAAFRSNLYGCDYDRFQEDGESYTNSYGILSPNGVAGSSTRGGASPMRAVVRRPTTASARVALAGHEENAKDERSGKERHEQRNGRRRGDDGHNFILDVSSDSDNDDHALGNSNDKWTSHGHHVRHSRQPIAEVIDYESFMDRPHGGNDSFGNFTGTNTNFSPVSNINTTPHHIVKQRNMMGDVDGCDYDSSVLTSLRNAIIARHNQHGLNLREMFNIFDKRCIRYIDAGDLFKTGQEFKIDMSYETSKSLVKLVAIDGVDRISFSEFAVWITDPDHSALQTTIQIQIAEQLEQQGREYQYLIYRVLSQGQVREKTDKDPSKIGASSATSGLVSVSAFVEALKTIGLELSGGDIDRIILRFDTHGSNQCSVSRFMRMAQNNDHWKDSLESLAYHEEAVEEAQVVRDRLHSSNRRAIPANVDDETLDMAEYLGIRVLSEPHLLWIVDEAIKAPLPADWAIHQDKEGRTFFFNASTQATRWDHPADPELRKLRDYHRKHHVSQSERNSVESDDLKRCESCGARATLCQDRSRKLCNHCVLNKVNSSNFRASSGEVKDTLSSYRGHNGNPKINTILLYSNTSGLKKGNKKTTCANRTTSSYLPKKTVTEKKRAASAGRLRKKIDAGRGGDPERNRALGRMFGDHVIEELDLAMQTGNQGTRFRQQHPSGGYSKNKIRSEINHGQGHIASSNILFRDERFPMRDDEVHRGRAGRGVPEDDMVWL